MIRAMHTSASGMKAQQLVVDTTANNLANVNTTGFKRNLVEFQDLIYINNRNAGSDGAQGLQVPTGLVVGSGVRPAATSKIFSEGALDHTEDKYHIAIEGEGFFQINLPNGQARYTRDGAFYRNVTGQLVTADGFALQPQITIPQDATSVSIGTDGTVSVISAGSPNTSTTIGNITIARFTNPAGLSAEGRNLFAETAASGTPVTTTPGQDGSGTLLQGFLERSNVEVVSELVNLILAQRAYEVNSRTIRAADEMLNSTNDIVR